MNERWVMTLKKTTLRMIGAAVIAVVLSGCGGATELPPELYGVWRTDEPRYADRFIELTAQQIVFGLGGQESSRHFITSVDTEATLAGARYTIEYRATEDDSISSVSLLTEHRDGLALRLHNQPSFRWRRRSS